MVFFIELLVGAGGGALVRIVGGLLLRMEGRCGFLLSLHTVELYLKAIIGE